MFLVSPEKEFKDRHREDLSKSRLLKVKQNKIRAKVHPPNVRNTALEVLRPQAFIEVCRQGGGQF
jgi:hypothetical protein